MQSNECEVIYGTKLCNKCNESNVLNSTKVS